MKQRILAALCMLIISHSLSAATLDVFADTRESYIGQPITLVMRIVSDVPIERPRLPKIEGFNVNEAGESRYDERSLGSGGSGRKVTMEYSWRLMPLQTGEFQDSLFICQSKNETLRSGELSIIILEPGPLDGYHLFLSTENDTAFPSIPVRLRLKWLFSSEVSRPDFTLPFLENEKIQIRDLDAPSSSTSDIYQFNVQGHTLFAVQSAEIYEGQQYASLTIEWDIYPSEPGVLNLDPVFLSFQRGVVDQQGRRKYIPSVIPSNPLKLNIKPLPGEVSTFPGGVLVADKELEVQASLDQRTVYPGDPLELTLSFKGLSSPQLTNFMGIGGIKEIQGMIKTDPSGLSSSFSGNEKTYTQKIRIQSSNIKDFPALKFPYYSLEAGEVRFSTSNSIPLDVKDFQTIQLDAEDNDVSVQTDSPVTKNTIALMPNRNISIGKTSPILTLFLMNRNILLFISLLIITILLILPAQITRIQKLYSFYSRSHSVKELKKAIKEYSIQKDQDTGLQLQNLFEMWLEKLTDYDKKENYKLPYLYLKSSIGEELFNEIQSLLNHLNQLWGMESTILWRDDYKDLPDKITKAIKKADRNK